MRPFDRCRAIWLHPDRPSSVPQPAIVPLAALLAAAASR
jgi:hypothetical protein